MSEQLKQWHEDASAIAKEMRQMADRQKDPEAEWKAEDEDRWQQANADYNALRKKIEMAERMEQVESELKRQSDEAREVREAQSRDSRDYPSSADIARRRTEATVEDHNLALQAWCLAQSGCEVSDEGRQAAARCGVKLHAREYEVRLARQYDDVRDEMHRGREYRAMSTSATAGGDTIPAGFVYNFEKALLAYGGVRQAATVIRTSSGNSLPWPTTNDTGNSAAILAENTQDSEQTVTTSVLTLGAYKLTSNLILVSQELIQDSAFQLGAELGRIIGERIARGENAYFTTGTGSSQPNGIVTAATAGKTAAAVNAITGDEVLDLLHSVDPAYRPGASFMMNDAVIAYIRKLKVGSADSRYLWEPSWQVGVPDRLWGYPVIVNQGMASTIEASAKTILFGQLSKYIIRDVLGLRLRRLVERYADYDQEAFVGFLRTDGDLLDAGTHPVKYLVQAAS